jgi:UDP-3-O-[3-hydroxymyristoyl] N-acetylglucosamine deacetylase
MLPVVPQTTLKHQVSCTGVGLHCGAKIHMCLRPGAPSTGVVFKRIDVPRGSQIIEAHHTAVSDTLLGTTISNSAGVSIATIEHLMAALAGSGIDNVLVELDGPEVPIMDGSAAPFVFLIECAGIQHLSVPRNAIRILKDIFVGDADQSAVLTPGAGFVADVEINYDNPAISRQRYEFDFSPASFKVELCRARTFGFLQEVEHLRKCGRARGGSLENAVVIDGDMILNQGGLRYPDEFVRHKLLDIIGDLYLLGAPIVGRFKATRPGHALNLKLVNEMHVNEEAWEYTTIPADHPESSVSAYAESADGLSAQLA